MKTNPKISIILPSLNVAKFIRECVESVIKQTLKDIEIICVDGGSTDGTLEILEEYSNIDSRIKLIHSDEQSYGYQMNLGINSATGEYIGIVETDDYIDEQMYEKLYAATNNGSVDISKSSFYHLHPNRIFADAAKKNLPTNEFTVFDDPTILKSHPSIWAAIYKKSFLKENNIYFMEAPGGGWVDNPFLFETFLSAKSIKYLDEPLYYYRELNPNSSSNNIKDLTLSMRRMLNIFDVLEKHHCNDKNILATFYIRIFWHIQDTINNYSLGNQKESVLYYINEVLKKLDEKIVNTNFGLNEQKLYYKYISPLQTLKTNGQKEITLTENELKLLKNEHDFLYSTLSKSEGNILNNTLIEKRIEYASNKLLKSEGNIKKINIGYVLDGFPNHSETFIVNEVKWLKENGFNITVFTKREPYKPVKIDFNVDIVRYNSQNELENLLIKHKIDIMHTHFIYPICTNFTFPVAEKLKIPFTVFAHAFDIFIKENTQRNNVSQISKSQYCLGIYTLSNFHKNYLIDCGAKEDKIIITKQATNYNLKDISIKPNKIKKIISISRFVEKKGLDTLIDAAKLLENEDFEFSIYGFGDLENQLQKQINDLNCTNIKIKGELAPKDVPIYLESSDLLVSACKIAKNGDMDGFPTIIFESMGVGTPILTTDVSSIPEIINDGENGFIVESNNPKALADKIKEISNLTPRDLLKIRENAQKDVENISNIEKTMHRYIDNLKNLDSD